MITARVVQNTAFDSYHCIFMSVILIGIDVDELGRFNNNIPKDVDALISAIFFAA